MTAANKLAKKAGDSINCPICQGAGYTLSISRRTAYECGNCHGSGRIVIQKEVRS